MSKPAHKQDDPNKMPGQIKNDVTLGDYIERKSKSMEKRIGIQSASPKKLTFDEWFDASGYSEYSRSICQAAWNTAQENK